MRMLTRVPASWVLAMGLILFQGSTTSASAQGVPVVIGSQVRFTLPCDSAAGASPGRQGGCDVQGDVVRFTPDTLVLRGPGGVVSYPQSWITGLQVRQVEGPDWKIPSGIGAVLGAAGTYAWLHSGGSRSLCDRSRNQDAIGRRECVVAVVLGGAVGAGLGALTNRLLRSERWVEVR